MMKRAMVTSIIGLLLFALTPQVHADGDDQCSVADLRGVYSFVVSGTVFPVKGGALPPGLFTAAGRTIYDGQGSAHGVIQASLANGNVTPVLEWTADYQVDPSNCTFTKTITLPGGTTIHFFITAGDDFKELRFITTDMGTAITGTARKQ